MTETEVTITDRAADWSRVLETAYKHECRQINENYPFERTLNIDLNTVPQTEFMHLLENLDETLQDVKDALVASHLIPKWELELGSLNIRFYNHPLFHTIKDLGASRLRKFVCFEGVVRRVHTTKPIITSATFQCPCGRYTHIVQRGRELTAPGDNCVCGRKSTSQKLVPELSETRDYQTIVVQEPPDKVLGSEVPPSIVVTLTDDLCNKINAGNRVILTGVTISYQNKPTDKVLGIEFEASHVSILDREFTEIEISSEEEEEILSIASDPNSWKNIVASIAPSIFGNETVKEAVALQLFGGVSDYNGDGTWKRGDIHVLLIGDPGIAKSKMMDVVLSLCPRGIMTSGRGSSVAGLTAAAVSDGSGGWTLDAGAAVLADRGQLLIDEMDKMGVEDRSALHRAMEQQEVPINKAGINTVLKSRCSILAAANPVSGRFDDYIDVASQFNLPPTLLSRFDLIFICKDVVDPAEDLKIAEFILSGNSSSQGVYSPDIMRKYISYAKQTTNPELSKEASSEIAEFYVRLRSLGGKNKPMPITPRQLEGLRRLSQASARSRLSNIVTREDARRAISMMENCLLHVAYDLDTKTYDIDRVVTNMSKVKRDIMCDLKEVIIEHGRGEAVPIKMIMEVMAERGHIIQKVERVLEEGYQNGAFTCPRRDLYKVM